MDMKTTLIFVLALLSVAAMLVGITNDSDYHRPEEQEEMEAPSPAIVMAVTPAPIQTERPEPAETVVPRYAELELSDEDIEEMVCIVWLEARGEPEDGQQAVAEVILNRVINQAFPNSVHEVIHDGEGSALPQFSTVYDIADAQPTEAQYAAVDAALYGPSVLPDNVVFFSTGGENDRVFRKIGGHIFCYEYEWD